MVQPSRQHRYINLGKLNVSKNIYLIKPERTLHFFIKRLQRVLIKFREYVHYHNFHKKILSAVYEFKANLSTMKSRLVFLLMNYEKNTFRAPVNYPFPCLMKVSIIALIIVKALQFAFSLLFFFYQFPSSFTGKFSSKYDESVKI